MCVYVCILSFFLNKIGSNVVMSIGLWVLLVFGLFEKKNKGGKKKVSNLKREDKPFNIFFKILNSYFLKNPFIILKG